MNKELKKACRIIADLVQEFNYPLSDDSYPIQGLESVFDFLQRHNFADFADEDTFKIHWEKLEEKL